MGCEDILLKDRLGVLQHRPLDLAEGVVPFPGRV